MNNHIVQEEVKINASPAVVWETVTNPDETEKYFFKTRVKSTWEVGGPITFSRNILGIYTFKLQGSIEKIEKGSLLKYKLMKHKWFGKPAPTEFSMVSISLLPEGDGTKVSVTDDVGDYEGKEARYEKSVKGWQKILQGMKRVAEIK